MSSLPVRCSASSLSFARHASMFDSSIAGSVTNSNRCRTDAVGTPARVGSRDPGFGGERDPRVSAAPRLPPCACAARMKI